MLQSLYSLAATGSFCWFLASSMVIFPHSLSYFNESIGGPLNGPNHLLGSAVDWGQDLRYVADWVKDVRKTHPVFYSGVRFLKFQKLEMSVVAFGDFPISLPTKDTELVYLAVSQNMLHRSWFRENLNKQMKAGYNFKHQGTVGYGTSLYKVSISTEVNRKEL